MKPKRETGLTAGARLIVTKDRPRNHQGGDPYRSSGHRPKGGPSQGKHWKDRPKGPRPPRGGGSFGDRREASFVDGEDIWIWGLHAVSAALANDQRKIHVALISPSVLERLGLTRETLPEGAQICEPREIDIRLPPGAVHQGVAIKASPLASLDISDAAMTPDRPLVILDSVTDPQNVGAIFRSAAAFGLGGVVMQTRRAPSLGGALAKAAAGAVEHVSEVRAVNLARAIDLLTESGWRVIGLDASAPTRLEDAVAGEGPLAIVMGAEGEGLRPAVAKACSGLARIPMNGMMESLNVSNAAAIAFYEMARGAPSRPAAAPARSMRPAEDDED